MPSWMPSPDTSEADAFVAYRDAALSNLDGAFPEYAKLLRILSTIPVPALATAATRQLTVCMQRDFHEHNRWAYHRDGSQVQEPEEATPTPTPEPVTPPAPDFIPGEEDLEAADAADVVEDLAEGGEPPTF